MYVCIDVSVCLYELVFLFFVPVCVCVQRFFIVCQKTLLAPAHAPGSKHCC